ncbi:hypothetical protein Poli38472_012541 [Pythium oligandrum]|uniref:Uncharacterized protein n=1 Tax=Pythium oligandrum TaxID=41045 RepID=A0A8K1FF78_PYTOL|nr:hypothetical protein Poli38472_012541 [Pythium oligandrum]|eukprot:TMW61350.1 hypothetical protein Poli38472_012541 [Pythium oligandrum]
MRTMRARSLRWRGRRGLATLLLLIMVILSFALVSLPVRGEVETTDADDMDPSDEPDEPETTQGNMLVLSQNDLIEASVPSSSLPDLDGVDTTSVAYHRKEYERLKILRTNLLRDLVEKEALVHELEAQVKQAVLDIESEHTKLLKPMPSPRGIMRSLSCLGWKKTSQCQWTGRRNAALDQSCFALVPGGSAGYCEIKDDDTGDFYYVMRANCTSIPPNVMHWCQVAPQFANFPVEIEGIMALLEPPVRTTVTTRGIVMVVRSSQIERAFAHIQLLRSLGCMLPVELWYFKKERQSTFSGDLGAKAQEERESHEARIQLLGSKVQELNEAMGGAATVTTRVLDTASTQRQLPYAKIEAIAQSDFLEVLYIDVEAVTLKNPTYLFDREEFRSTGAIFWPDLFHPVTTQSNIQPASLLWEYLDMPFVDMFEQDSRQLLVHRGMAQKALRLLDLFVSNQPSIFEQLQLVDKDKDLFRLAWLRSKTAFHMVSVPPSVAGEPFPNAQDRFCGTTVVQHDLEGDMLFMHHIPTAFESQDLKHLLQFDWRSAPGNQAPPLSDAEIRELYVIHKYQLGGSLSSATTDPAETSAPKGPMCFGRERISSPGSHFSVTPWSSTPAATMLKRMDEFVRKTHQSFMAEALDAQVSPE